MMRRAVLLKNSAFVALSVLVLGFLGVRYADAGRWLGVDGSYTVTLDLPETGGLFPNADVTYRGVSVGRVGAIRLGGDGVQAELRLRDGGPRIPKDLKAVVADLSAVGEEYVDLQPTTDQGPYLADGDQVPASAATVPRPVTDVLGSVDALAASVPLASLRTVVTELGDAFAGQGQNLQVLLDDGSRFTGAATQALPATTALIGDGATVLRTQSDEAGALRQFATGARQLAAQLAASDGDLRRLIATAPLAATQVDQLVQQVGPDLGVVLGNMLTTADVAVTRQRGVQELLVQLPRVVTAGATAIDGQGAHLGMAVTFFSPLPCVQGYGGTRHRSGTDTTDAPWNTAAGCTAPASSGTDVRGSGR
ncbi:MCE family protein [Streptacidiphilus monticola]|uniref:MCE family protein n=1 Tax=Streptacidiphilus monticola TaxID=2161674 RepID=A0ABW1G7L1_9ACTN